MINTMIVSIIIDTKHKRDKNFVLKSGKKNIHAEITATVEKLPKCDKIFKNKFDLE